MVNDKAEFLRSLDRWLEDRSILAETRKFLNLEPLGKRSGLGDGQIANWRRRGRLPGTFVEGAALYRCARPASSIQKEQWAERMGIEGDAFWQIFIVYEEVDPTQPALDVCALQYWQGVRALRGVAHLTQAAYRSRWTKEDGQNDDVSLSDVRSLPGEDESFKLEAEEDGALFASWDVGSAPRDCGFVVYFPGAIKNHQSEAVGGTPRIPVDVAHTVTFLPRTILERVREKRLPSNPKGVPSAFAALLDHNPGRVMEDYLGLRDKPETRGNFRRLGPWFKEGPQVERWEGAHYLPPSIRKDESFQRAESALRAGEYEAFATHIDNPEPFLRQMMVFG